MPLGKIPFPDWADIKPLDVEATDDNVNPITRERIKTPGSTDGSQYKATVRIPALLEHDRSELVNLAPQSAIPEGARGLVVHMREMRRGDGTNSWVNPDGTLIFLRGKLIQTLERKTLDPIEVFNGNPLPEMYCFDIVPTQSSLGGRGPNMRVMLFRDRPPGRMR
jgi:hypothetical protein